MENIHQPVLLFLNMGLGEILLIMVFFLMFFGTKNIPQIAQKAGKFMRMMRDASSDIKKEITQGAEQAIKEAGIEESVISELNEVKKAIKPDQDFL